MLISLDQVHEQDIEVGEFLNVVVVKAANIVYDLISGFQDAKGGHMTVSDSRYCRYSIKTIRAKS
jgi:hypothetical protein